MQQRYTYDANGNLTGRVNSAQARHNITAVSYNHLNLPRSVTATAGTTAYSYDASGRKLRSDHYPFGLQYPQNVLAGTPGTIPLSGIA